MLERTKGYKGCTSAFGAKRTCWVGLTTSALEGATDVPCRQGHFRLGPKGDMRSNDPKARLSSARRGGRGMDTARSIAASSNSQSDRRVQLYRPNAHFVIIGLTGAGAGAAGGERMSPCIPAVGPVFAANSQ